GSSAPSDGGSYGRARRSNPVRPDRSWRPGRGVVPDRCGGPDGSEAESRRGLRSLRLIRRLVAEEAADRSAEGEAEALEPGRRERQPDVVEVVPGDDGEPQRVRHALLRDLAVLGEREHRLDQLLEAERGRDLADEVRRLVPDVAELVRRSRRDEHAVAGLRDELPLAEPELELAGEDLESLLLPRMDVGGGDCAV